MSEELSDICTQCKKQITGAVRIFAVRSVGGGAEHYHCPSSSSSQIGSNAFVRSGSERASAPIDPEGEQSKSESSISALGRAPVLESPDYVLWALTLSMEDLADELLQVLRHVKGMPKETGLIIAVAAKLQDKGSERC